ncbi:MAG: DUF4293 domain-containing protein [Bacteroidota bacterium]
MIQRIQSIYLFLAAGAAFALFAVPFATTPEVQADSVIFADATFNTQDSIAMMAGFGLAGLLLLVIIFLYNNRKLQMNLTKVGIFLAGVGVGGAAQRYFSDSAADAAQFAAGVALPALIIIFAFLALRSINKDEKLVRSVDRLR